MKSLHLYYIFCKISLFTFGGGYAMIPLFQNELVTRQQFVSYDDFANMVALAQITPGPIGMNAATYVGYDQTGLLGALLATLGVITPSLVVTMLVAAGINRYQNSILVKSALAGIRPAILGLIAAAVIFFAETSVFTAPLKSLWQAGQSFSICLAGLVVFLTTIAIECFWKPNLLLTITIAGTLGLLLGMAGF